MVAVIWSKAFLRCATLSSRVGTVPSEVATGQRSQRLKTINFDPALPRSVLCLFGIPYWSSDYRSSAEIRMANERLRFTTSDLVSANSLPFELRPMYFVGEILRLTTLLRCDITQLLFEVSVLVR